MPVNGKTFTPTHRRILEVLSDGLPHHRDEIRAVLNDELAVNSTIRNHISQIRKMLRPRGEDIVCELIPNMVNGSLFARVRYRHIRLLRSAVDGRT